MNKQMVCNWHEVDSYLETYWETDCNQAFSFTDGESPAEQDFAYCPYCGKVLNGKEIEHK